MEATITDPALWEIYLDTLTVQEQAPVVAARLVAWPDGSVIPDVSDLIFRETFAAILRYRPERDTPAHRRRFVFRHLVRRVSQYYRRELARRKRLQALPPRVDDGGDGDEVEAAAVQETAAERKARLAAERDAAVRLEHSRGAKVARLAAKYELTRVSIYKILERGGDNSAK